MWNREVMWTKSHKSRLIKKNLDFLLGIHLMVSSPNIYPYCFIVISIATPIIRDGIRINFYFIKLNLFFASQVSKKNIINLKKKN